MLITKFGSTYAGGFTFSQVQASNGFNLARPPVVAEIDGSAGAYDFIGADNFPLAAQPIQIAHDILSDTYAAVDDDLDALKAATLCLGRDKLWGLVRDGSKRWTWAKCIGLNYSEKYREQTIALPVGLSFMLADGGVWYEETESDTSAPASPFTATNNGNSPAHVRFNFTAFSTAAYTIAASNGTNGTGWSWTGNMVATKHLIIDSAAMTAKNDGANAYSGLTPTDPTRWLTLDPGANTITWSFTGLATASHFYWYDTYL